MLCCAIIIVRAPVDGQGSPQLSLPELPVVASSSVSCSGQCWAPVSVLGTVLPWRPVPGLGVLLLPHSPWQRVETITKPEFLPSSQKVLSASTKLSGQPLSCCPMTLKCFKQNRVDGGVLLRKLQGRGSQIQAAARALGLGLGTGKTKPDQHVAAPGLAETE